MEIKLIGFDLDNTLYVQTDEMQNRVRDKIYERLTTEFDIPFDAARELFEENYDGEFAWSHSGSRTIDYMAEMFERVSIDGKEIVQRSIDQADVVDLISANPDLVEMLNRLSRKYYLDLITGTSYDLAFAKLERIGIDKDIFGNTFANKEYGSKTDGEVYLHWLGVRGSLPNQTLYVGDNKKQDIYAPNLLGIRTCMVGGEYDKAGYQIGNILELEALLK